MHGSKSNRNELIGDGITTAEYPNFEPGQTLEEWFVEKDDAGGFHAYILSKEYVTAANQKGFLVKFGSTPTSESGKFSYYLNTPTEDLFFAFEVGRGGNESNLLPECKNVFDLMTQTLNIKAQVRK